MRYYEKLTTDDLKEMRDYALRELERFCQIGQGKYSIYKEKLVAICLCQGAAKHYVYQKNGVEDIDIWFFFEEDENVKIPHIGNMRKLIWATLTKLGTKPFDFLKKMIPLDFVVENDKSKTIHNYLERCKTRTAEILSEKPIVGLYPDEVFGKVLWLR